MTSGTLGADIDEAIGLGEYQHVFMAASRLISVLFTLAV
jgi:hypothetical protein